MTYLGNTFSRYNRKTVKKPDDLSSSKWKAYLVQTTTGVIITELSIESGKYSIPLNDIETMSAVIVKNDLSEKVYREMLRPWYGSLLFTFEDRAIVAGPITKLPKEYSDVIHVEAQGIRAIFEKRYLVEEMSDESFGNNLSKSVIFYNSRTLGTIAQDVVRFATDNKPGGALPIRYPSMREPMKTYAGNQRTYKGFNISNLSVDFVLTKLSNVRNGPDIMFRPVKIKNMVFWDMYHGTKDNYRIAQKSVPFWNLDVEGQANDIEITVSGENVLDRAFVVGGGTDTGTVIQATTSTKRVEDNFPFLERTFSGGNDENPKNLKSHADAYVQQYSRVQSELTFSVHAWDESTQWPLGMFFVGDLVRVKSSGYFSIPDGVNEYRLLNIHGDFGGELIRISMQSESQWNNLSKEEYKVDESGD